jgi:hypothetical protein
MWKLGNVLNCFGFFSSGERIALAVFPLFLAFSRKGREEARKKSRCRRVACLSNLTGSFPRFQDRTFPLPLREKARERGI